MNNQPTLVEGITIPDHYIATKRRQRRRSVLAGQVADGTAPRSAVQKELAQEDTPPSMRVILSRVLNLIRTA